MTPTVSIETVVARWNNLATRPLFKDKLIDTSGDKPCFCAQGDILHEFCDWNVNRLLSSTQYDADTAIMGALGISRAHSILLRRVNDSAEGTPAIVLTNPELVIGDQAPHILKFWQFIDNMTNEDWEKVYVAAVDAAGEIQGSSKLDKFFFLPMFGFSAPSDLDRLA